MARRGVGSVAALALLVALVGCAGPGATAPNAPTSAAQATAAAATAAPDPAGPATEPPQGGAAPLPDGTVAMISVRGGTYTVPEAGVSTCIVGTNTVTVVAGSNDPRLILTIAWRSEGTRHLSFGNPVGSPGVWQAGDEIEGASTLEVTRDGRTATLTGGLRHTDQTIDQATIRIAC